MKKSIFKTVFEKMTELRDQEAKIRTLILENLDNEITEPRFKKDEVNRLLDELKRIHQHQVGVQTKA